MRAGYVLNGRYQVKRRLGEGGMANVYLARDLILHRLVALKLMRLDLRDDAASVRRFQREAISLTKLSHPNIVNIYDVGEDNGIQYLVTEYVEGTDLKKYISENFPIDFVKVIDIMEQILAAVAHAHAHGIIHRDLKPQNILIDHQGHVKITDFGIALATGDSLTQTTTLMGSVHYLSPEQARGSIVTKQSDIYSLGIILFELLVGHVPFQGETAVSIALKHSQSQMPSVRQFNPKIPQALENVVLHATAKDLTERYQSANEMAADLKTALSPARKLETRWQPSHLDDETKLIEPKTKGNPAAARKLSKKVNRKKWWLIGSGILIFIIILIILGLAFQPHSVKVPNLQGMTSSEATTVLENQHLKLGTVKYQYNSKYYRGQVIRTSPAAKTSVKQSSTIDLILSKGPQKNKFGDYRGQSFKKVKRELEKKGVTVLKTIKHSQNFAAGEISSQSISPSRKVIWKDTTVTFTVSSGSKKIRLRDLTGYTRKSVEDYADELGLVLNARSQTGDYGEQSDTDLAVEQQPLAGTYVRAGSTLTVIFSHTSTSSAASVASSSEAGTAASSAESSTSSSTVQSSSSSTQASTSSSSSESISTPTSSVSNSEPSK